MISEGWIVIYINLIAELTGIIQGIIWPGQWQFLAKTIFLNPPQNQILRRLKIHIDAHDSGNGEKIHLLAGLQADLLDLYIIMRFQRGVQDTFGYLDAGFSRVRIT